VEIKGRTDVQTLVKYNDMMAIDINTWLSREDLDPINWFNPVTLL
jgi:hypothetical protein